MACPNCQFDNRSGRRFCAQCGARLKIPCPNCEFVNEAGERYCGGCGRPTDDGADHPACSPPTPQAGPDPARSGPERRHLTVMFCDLVGSTSLAARLDPEDWRHVLRRYQETGVEVLSRYGGFVSRYVGDGILVLFGFPHAHEDEVERAILAGLDLVHNIRQLSRDLAEHQDFELAVRVGIATGVVVVGDLVGKGALEKQAVIGKTPNLAARLQDLAEPNSVIISAETKQLSGGQFEYQDLGLHELKGIGSPVRAWRALGSRQMYSRFEAARRGGLTRLVGRRKEIDFLYDRWQRTKKGNGQIIHLCGDAGMGKSRIVHAVREKIGAEPHTVLVYQCSSPHQNTALYPMIRTLRAAADIDHKTGAEEQLECLAQFLQELSQAPTTDEFLYLMADLLSIPVGERFASMTFTPEQQKAKTFAVLVEQLEKLAAEKPVLLIIEDAHWIDPTSRELLSIYTRRIRKTPILMIITFRPGFTPPWDTQSHINTLSLDRLSTEESALMIRYAAGKSLPSEVVDQILQKTDGIPLFVEELTKTLQTSGLLREESDRYVLQGPLPSRAIPTTLHDSLLARLDQLAKVKEVAQIGAAIGREFTYDLLMSVADISHVQLASALAQLVDSEIIFKRGSQPNPSYVFKHALVQDAAYESLLKSTRQELHSRIADVLVGEDPERLQAEPEVLAYHYNEAALYEKAIKYFAMAAGRALERSANWEVVGHVTNAMRALEALPDVAQRRQWELTLQLTLGAAYRATKGFGSEETEQAFLRARKLCETVGNPVQLADALRGLYACAHVRGELKTARQQALRVLELGRQLDSNYAMVGHWMLGCSLFWQGEFANARDQFEQAWSLYDAEAQQTQLLSHQIDPGISTLMHLGWTLWAVGYPEKSRTIGNQAIEQARRLSQPHAMAMALFFACCTEICCGDLKRTEELCRQLRSMTDEHEFAYLGACASIVEGQILIVKGEFTKGLARIALGMQGFKDQHAGLGQPWAMSLPILAYLQTGKTEEGLRLIEAARKPILENGEHHWEAELNRLQGELLLAGATPDLERAKVLFEQALAIARNQGSKSLELRAATSLAGLLHRQHRNREGHELLNDVYHWFTEGLDTQDLKTARELLELLDHDYAHAG